MCARAPVPTQTQPIPDSARGGRKPRPHSVWSGGRELGAHADSYISERERACVALKARSGTPAGGGKVHNFFMHFDLGSRLPDHLDVLGLAVLYHQDGAELIFLPSVFLNPVMFGLHGTVQ